MSLRFRQSFTLFPGVRINIGKRGISTSIGVSGATLNIGKNGVRATVGIPGSGLSYSTRVFAGGEKPTTHSEYPTGPVDRPSIVPSNMPENAPVYMPTDGMREIGSAAVEVLTSSSLIELRDMFTKARAQEKQVKADLNEAETALADTSSELKRRKSSIFRFFYKRRIFELADFMPKVEAEVLRLKDWSGNTKINVSFETSDDAQRAYGGLVRAFDALRGCAKIWDVTSDRDTNKFVERTIAVRTIARHPVNFEFTTTDLIQFEGRAMKFGNFNGDDILIYPGLAVIPRADGVFALIEIRELEAVATRNGFHEAEDVPRDTKIIGETWAKTNKDGSPDKRFKENYSVPVVEYGHLVFSSGTGITEEYKVSNADAAIAFAAALSSYKEAL